MAEDSKKDLEKIYYEKLVGAFINNNFERDKTLINLATAGIGLIATLMAKYGFENLFQLVVFSISGLAFISTIVLCLLIFKGNTKYLLEIHSQNKQSDPHLGRLDKLVFICFIAGVVSAALGAGAIGINQHKKGSLEMADENQKRVSRYDSLAELGKLVPENQGKSLNDLGKLKPETSQHNQPQQQQSQQNTGEKKD